MRNTTMVAATAAAAAAAAALSGTAASASTPDWLTIADVETDHDSVLPVVCEADDLGPLTATACGTVLGSPSEDELAAGGMAVPESPGDFGGMPAVANIDLRNFAKWQVCGVAVAASSTEFECDNSIPGPTEPVGPGSGVSLVNADATGALQWSVCGITVGGTTAATTC
ncbi:hypothetical protein [Glycomyces sp. NRRL B-16210]|uniref:hypothetical protein n=1 Tax=Glycomyces sp. NRRL B-16210 TaxID=1463821 RepID=UPI0004C1B7D7|nr:hypothetical protein [Glycomyces sp. NRRL B-16210]